MATQDERTLQVAGQGLYDALQMVMEHAAREDLAVDYAQALQIVGAKEVWNKAVAVMEGP